MEVNVTLMHFVKYNFLKALNHVSFLRLVEHLLNSDEIMTNKS